MRHIPPFPIPQFEKLWFTSDTHFWHKNIVVYSNRPFLTVDGQPDVEKMNESLIRYWNDCVKPDDLVIHLGDMGFGRDCTSEKLREIRQRLNGTMLLVRGNHDHKPRKWLLPKDKIADELQFGPVYMAHVPVFAPPTLEVTTVICGHVHEQFRDVTQEVLGQTVRYINVGVDVWNYAPVSPEMLAVPLLEELVRANVEK